MQQTDGVKATLAEVVAGRKQQFLPGRMFVEAVVADGTSACVEYDVTITDSLTSSRRKPRHPARNMLKVVDLSRDPRKYYWQETRPASDDGVSGADLRPEAANRFGLAPVPELLTTTAWVQVPPGLWEDPETFESFINYRLIVRLATAENVTIIRGAGGLLELPAIARMTSKGQFASTILRACNEVEQMGCTADGLIINPADYYDLLGSWPPDGGRRAERRLHRAYQAGRSRYRDRRRFRSWSTALRRRPVGYQVRRAAARDLRGAGTRRESRDLRAGCR